MNESTWFSAIVGASLKSTVLLGGAWLISLLLRRRSAASRHLVWTAAAAAVLVLPFLSVSLPPLPVRASTTLVNPGLVFQVLGIARADSTPETPRSAAAARTGGASAPWRPDLEIWLL